MSQHFYTTMHVGNKEYELFVTGDYEPFVPARIYGDPDDCYPAEGGTFTVTSVKVVLGKKEPLDEIELPRYMIEALETEGYEYFAGAYEDEE